MPTKKKYAWEKKAKHTPAPWEIVDKTRIEAKNYGMLASLRGEVSAHRETVTDANAKLIAAAPDLLAMLIEAEAHLSYCGYGDSWERECAQASKLEERILATIEKQEGIQMTKSKHTSGPWMMTDCFNVVKPNGDTALEIADVCYVGDESAAEANARLIAAAPDLLDALEGLMPAIESCAIGAGGAAAFARKAITKAKGEIYAKA